ncbi:hypothetical protein HDA32_002893 [Spinactinospora alkalitolerans]|uniref:Peptidase U32 n=1 Tax=Spinactinospora alkalitolerans TaxID=687207 RepID=A0A852TY93_9ACTN|nr:U32 family peptidase [Spinactinospora alkalitolerans]NYE47773.1 hypothetical protein [Spinactinospora alkalitolerans]
MTDASSPFVAGRSALESLGVSGIAADPPGSARSFPDGGAWRLEIPSVEGPRAMAAVIEAAAEWEVPVHRVSQGSGVTMLTDGEITAMVQTAEETGIELCLFARPGANWDIGGAHASAAGSVSARSRGGAQLAAGVAEAERAAGLGVRSLLVADEGLLWVLHRLRCRGDLPADLQLKVSVMAAPANPAALRVHELLGADTVNVPSDLTLHQLAELRASSPVALDFYVEAPDNIGGFVRHHEIAEIIRAAAPVYVKFGLRNAPDVYPSGEHLGATVVASARERVRRARIGLDVLARTPAPPKMSPLGERGQPAASRFELPVATGAAG